MEDKQRQTRKTDNRTDEKDKKKGKQNGWQTTRKITGQTRKQNGGYADILTVRLTTVRLTTVRRDDENRRKYRMEPWRTDKKKS